MSAEQEYGGTKAKDRKVKYRAKLIEYLGSYKNIMIIKVDNVGSNQMQKARIKLRGHAAMLMGKNTIMRKVVRDEAEKNPKLADILPFVIGNIGFVFTNEDLPGIRSILEEEKVAAAAKPGQIAPDSVMIPPGITALDPGQTTFFQAMNIATKITKGAIEIINNVKLITKGERVTSSAVGLLNKLGLKPFFYSITVHAVYDDGCVYAASVLDLTTAELSRKFGNAVSKLASISLAIGYANAATVPHSFANALKTLVSLALATKYTFAEAQKYRDFLENPELLAAAQAASGGAASSGEAAAAAPEPEPEEEEEEEAAVSMFDEEADY